MTRKIYLHIAVIVVLLILLIFAVAARAQTKIWSWAPLNQPHHKAIVKVFDSAGFAGTGTLICADAKYENGYILTAAHCVSHNTTMSARWHGTDYTSRGKVVYKDSAGDVAVFHVDPPTNAPTIPIFPRKEGAPRGSQVECIGLGSPISQAFRPYYGKVIDVNTIDTHVTHGDSGGPIIYDGCVIGTVIGGYHTRYRFDGYNIYSPMMVSTTSSLHRALTSLPYT